jgi:hypothetical protein
MEFEPEKWAINGLVVCEKESGGLFIFEADQLAGIESDDPSAPITSVLIRGMLCAVSVRACLSDLLTLVAKAQDALRQRDADRNERRAAGYLERMRATLYGEPMPKNATEYKN